MNGEDSDITVMLKVMSRALSAKRPSVSRYVLLLLTSSPFWSENRLRSLPFLRSAQLSELL